MIKTITKRILLFISQYLPLTYSSSVSSQKLAID